MPLDQLISMFVTIDDFCNDFSHHSPIYLPSSSTKRATRKRAAQLSPSEIITILVSFHHSGYRTFKAFYTQLVCPFWGHLFPGLVSYNRFIELSQRCGLLLLVFLKYRGLGACSGISFVDSTVLRVCHPKRIKRNKVFRGLATTSKSTMGWFHGFKLHLIINDKGEILDFYLTKANVDDRDAKVMMAMTQELFGYLVGDKGYISAQLSALLNDNGITLLTQVRRNMKEQALSNEERILLRKRSVIETVNDELKNMCQIEHTRHRSVNGFLLNVIAALTAYSFFPKKPSITPIVQEPNPIKQKQFKQQLLLVA
jgi:hypothetical protein